MIRTDEFNYDLPQSLIAQQPLAERDHSRLMVVDRLQGNIIHDSFPGILKYLDAGDILVLNDTRVIPARIWGNRANKDEQIEILLIRSLAEDIWECLVKPGRKMQKGSVIFFGNKLKATVENITNDGSRYLRFQYDKAQYSFMEIIHSIGTMPTPPYISQRLIDQERYQTVYARETGSVAAPTAGLHFTKDLLQKVEEAGIQLAYITLHVGIGTFRPIKTEYIQDHKMHSEFYSLSAENADLINKARLNKGRVIAVGTTTTRTLESISDNDGYVRPDSGWTDIFISPGYKFKAVDGLITNFHLPQSTLLMLVSAFSSREIIMHAYSEAINQRYRFYSFGDAMLIL